MADQPECQGADFSRVATALAQGIEDHIRRDNMPPLKAALFRARGGHAPGDICPTAAPAEPIHDQMCALVYDGDECDCGAQPADARLTGGTEQANPLPADEHHYDTACDDRPYCRIPEHHALEARP